MDKLSSICGLCRSGDMEIVKLRSGVLYSFVWFRESKTWLERLGSEQLPSMATR